MSATADDIRRVLDPILGAMGLTLWDLEFNKQGPKWLLRVYIDREQGGVTLNDCETVSRDLSATLDVEDLIPLAYTLEVSSPGLDRTLTLPDHFTRFSGSEVKVKTYQQINGQKVFQGKLLGLVNGAVRVELASGTVMEIPLGDVAKASLEVKY